MTSKLLATLVGVAATTFACPAPAAAHPDCPVVDTFARFMDLSARTAAMSPERQAQVFRDDYLARYRDLYAAEVMPLPVGAELDGRALKSMARVRTHPELRTFNVELAASMRRLTHRFEDAFPDFQCDFPVYTTETFGFMDGAGRDVRGRPALVFGVDTIAQYWTPGSLPVFLSHELFHRYHFQAAGFSDDLAERDLIWRSIRAEGLATYVSAKLNPSNPMSDVLMVPKDLEARAKPFVPQMAAELLASADTVDAKTFGKFFSGGDTGAARLGWPSRSGYYVGYLVAEDLGRSRGLSELAHMKGPELRAAIGKSLERLSHAQ
jgi:hypothetical protein